MTFLNFGALFGLAAISIPVIIHLLNKMQVKEVQWAAMRFLQESIEKHSRRIQLEEILLMLLRCLLIALLILALSRPTWTSGTASTGSHLATAVIIIDNSYSMGCTNGIQTRLERAQAAAEQILMAFPTGSSSALFFAADNVQPVIAEPTYDFNLLRQSIRKAKLTDRATDLSSALQRAVTTLQQYKGGGAKEIYLITDGQANGWPTLDQLTNQLEQIKKEMTVHLVLVGDAAESNLGVTGLRVESGLTPVNQQLRCSVEVLNGSTTEARDVRVSLQVDDEPPADEAIIPSIQPGTSASAALFAKLHTEGFHTLTAKLSPDRLPADDKRTVAVRAIRAVKVLLVTGTTPSTTSQSDDFYIRNALVPVSRNELDDYYIKTTTTSVAQLHAAALDEYDAVFLLDLPSIQPGDVSPLLSYVQQGGGLVIFPGPGSNLDLYNEQLGHDGFMPVRFGQAKGDPNHQDKYFKLQAKDYDHPLVTLWNNPSAGSLASSHFFSYYQMTPQPWTAPAKGAEDSVNGQPRVVAHFEPSGDPFAVEHTWGSGRVVVFSGPATAIWNDLPKHAAFVPLINHVLGSLVGRQDEGLNIRVGQRFSYGVNSNLLRKDVSVAIPGSTEPPRVIGQVTLVNGRPTVEFPDTDESGAYKVSIAGSPPTLLDFAAQSDPNESNLTPLSATQLDALNKVAEVIHWTPDYKLSEKITAARVGTELWGPLLLAALIIATLETFLAQRFSRSK